MVTSRVACERRHENFIPPPKFQTFGNFWKFDSVFSSFRIDLRQRWNTRSSYLIVCEHRLENFNFWKFDPFFFLFALIFDNDEILVRVILSPVNVASKISFHRRNSNFWKLLEIRSFFFSFSRWSSTTMKYSFELFYRLWTSPRKFHSTAEIQTFGNWILSFSFRVDLR